MKAHRSCGRWQVVVKVGVPAKLVRASALECRYRHNQTSSLDHQHLASPKDQQMRKLDFRMQS